MSLRLDQIAPGLFADLCDGLLLYFQQFALLGNVFTSAGKNHETDA